MAGAGWFVVLPQVPQEPGVSGGGVPLTVQGRVSAGRACQSWRLKRARVFWKGAMGRGFCSCILKLALRLFILAK